MNFNLDRGGVQIFSFSVENKTIFDESEKKNFFSNYSYKKNGSKLI